MVKKSLNIIFLFLIHSSLYSQIFQPTSSLLLEKNNIKESSISLKIKTEQVIFKSLDIDELKIQIKRNNIDVENQIAILQNSITNVMMDKQELLKLIDIKKMQEQIEIKKQSRKDIEQQMQKDLSNLTFQGLYLVLLNDIDMWASKGKLSNRAEKLLAPIAIEDLNGVFISSLTVIKNKKLLTDDISSQVSGQMTIEKQYISKTIDNRSKFIYLIKVNVASLKKSNILKDNSNDLPENYLVINLLSDNDYKTKLQNQGISDDDIKATEFEVNLGKIAIDGTNSTSSRRQQKIIRTGFSNIAKIDDDIALLEEKLANQGSYLKQTIESLTTVIYDDNDMESSINKAMQYFDDQVEELEQQLLDVKEKELVAKYAVNVTTEGNPADDIAKTAFNVYKQIKQSYSKIEQFIHETKVSNSILVSDISGNAQDIFRDVEKIWLYPVAGDNDNFVLTVVAQFKIPHRKKSSRTSYINDSEKLGDMVYVAGGTFLMGSKEFYDETPVHRVVLDAFYIDKYEVTNKQFCEFLNAKRRHATNNALWLDISNKDSKNCNL